MSRFLERAKELRGDDTRHYNCAQAVLIPCVEYAGIDHETAYRIAAAFGGGMKRASVCGAVTGGLMALGLFGMDDNASVGRYYRAFKEHHEGMMDCGDLLRVSAQNGIPRSEHCDGLVFECVGLVEEILKEAGKIE